jgi:hypothetical protein
LLAEIERRIPAVTALAVLALFTRAGLDPK